MTLADLFDIEEAGRRFADAVQKNEGLVPIREGLERHLGRQFLKTVSSAGANRLKKLADVSLGQVLVWGWARHRDLRKALDASKDPDAIEVFVLGEHTIDDERHPRIEVYILEQRVGAITFDLTIGLTIQGVILEIQEGRIRKARAGACTASALLALHGQELAKFASREIPLSPEMEIDEPVAPAD